MPNFVRGGLAEGFVKMSPYGPGRCPTPARKNVDAVKAEIMKGGFSVFKGPLKDNKGNVVVPAGKALPETAIELEIAELPGRRRERLDRLRRRR